MIERLFAVVDIETTGMHHHRDKITEIAIAIYDGNEIIDCFESLINPERSIPFEITRITGITDEMVENAPKFYEVAKKIVEMTENNILVAHNSRFDYGFLKAEFSSLGFTFTRTQLDTVVLSRKSFPGLKSYSLGNLIRHFDIKVANRHRAMDDVLATVDILSRAINLNGGNERIDSLIKTGIRSSQLPPEVSYKTIESLPETPGVYYFYNTYGNIIYVGKSINIKKRVLQHFNKITEKSDKLVAMTTGITFEETGSELIAMLMESAEIKALQPKINKAQKIKEFPYFIYTYTDDNEYIRFSCDKSTSKLNIDCHIISHYATKRAAGRRLNQIVELFSLCPKLTGVQLENSICFEYLSGQCHGACEMKESPESYNKRVIEATLYLNRTFETDFLILLNGREANEKGLVLVENGQYRGYGYIPADKAEFSKDGWRSSIKNHTPNPEYNQIIMTWLEKHPKSTIINL